MTKKMSLDEYKTFIKEKRLELVKNPYDLVYDIFTELGYDKKDKKYIRDNASTIIEQLRDKCWEYFISIEKEFITQALEALIDEDYVEKLTSSDAIKWYFKEYGEYIYAVTLSNTQSRRSRAGNEFEVIIELILMGAGITFDSQGNIGKDAFIKKGLSKSVDFVLPSVLHYTLNKRDTVLISAKTTLRERWQEVPEEMVRTGAREMFLATLDSTVSNDVLDTLYETNIQLVTTQNNIKKKYSHNPRVLSFERLLTICLETCNEWKKHSFSTAEIDEMKKSIYKQMKKHHKHEFVKKYYNQLLKDISGE